jgi:hypothetical protein
MRPMASRSESTNTLLKPFGTSPRRTYRLSVAKPTGLEFSARTGYTETVSAAKLKWCNGSSLSGNLTHC